MKKIKITISKVQATATLNNSKTAEAIWQALPLEAKASRWGDEIYFYIKVKCAAENAKEVVELGDLGYWLEGPAFCIFFGKTPASKGNEIRPSSAVNVFGRVDGDVSVFKQVKSGEKIVIEKLRINTNS